MTRSRPALVAVAVNTAALAVVAASWSAAAARVDVATQLPWLATAALAVLAAALADAGVVIALRRRLSSRASALLAWAEPVAVGTRAPSADAPASPRFVSVPGGRSAHQPSCQLVAGKGTGPAPSGAPACPVCRP